MDRVPKGYYPMKLVSPVQQTTERAKKLVAQRRALTQKAVKRPVPKKRGQTRTMVQRKKPVQKQRAGSAKRVQKKEGVQKQKSIKGGRKDQIVGSFVRRTDILS